MIINTLIFERSDDDSIIFLSYDKVVITNNFRLWLFYQNANVNKHKRRICPLS